MSATGTSPDFAFGICQKCNYPTTDYDPSVEIVICALCHQASIQQEEILALKYPGFRGRI